MLICFFFFSSRRRHTRYWRDWSSDVCSSDLREAGPQDYVVVTLKAHSLPGAAPAMQPLLGPETAVVSAVNGLPWWYFYRHPGSYEDRRLASVDPDGRLWELLHPSRAIGDRKSV